MKYVVLDIIDKTKVAGQIQTGIMEECDIVQTNYVSVCAGLCRQHRSECMIVAFPVNAVCILVLTLRRKLQ
jgi:hypothetical protein